MSARDPRWPGLVAAYLEHNRDGAFGTTENAWVCAEHDALRHIEKGGSVSTIFELQEDGSTLVKSVGEPVQIIPANRGGSGVRPRKVSAAPAARVGHRDLKPANLHRDLKPANVLPEQRGLFS